MADGKLALADALLEKLIADFPGDPLADEARVERGRLAYLGCRKAALAREATAKACFERFLAEYPDSPRRAEVVDWLEAAR